MSAPSFALVLGLFYLSLGFLGMLSSLVLPAAPGASFGYLFGLFPVSWLMNTVHVLIGGWGLVAWSGAAGAVRYARSAAILLGLMALFGLLPGTLSLSGLLPLQGANVWLHALSAAAAAYIGYRSALRHGARRAGATPRQERRHLAADRRVSAHYVAYERRHGAFDRRKSGYGSLAAG